MQYCKLGLVLQSLVFLVFGSKLHAEIDVNSVVKIRSGFCNDISNQTRITRLGSGTIVQGPFGKPVILTSSHVVYHANKANAICHQFRTPQDPTWHNAQLTHVATAMGVAILESSLELETGISLSERAYSPRTKVATLGYPSASDLVPTPNNSTSNAIDPITSYGMILRTSSLRHLLPQLSWIVELEGAHSEKGMSGGPTFGVDEFSYVGMISHQVLAIQEGRNAVVTRVGSPLSRTHAVLLPLVIPAQEIAKWFTSISSNKSVDLYEDLEDQLKGISSIIFGGIKVSESECSANAVGGIGGQGGGVGGTVDANFSVALRPEGGQGGGVGGGQGDEKEFCDLRISRVNGEKITRQEWPFADSKEWFKSLSARLEKEPLIISTMISKKDFHETRIRGLYHGLTLIKMGFVPDTKGGTKANFGPLMTSQLQIIDDTSRRLKNKINKEVPKEVQLIVDSALALKAVIESGRVEVVDVEKVRKSLKADQGAIFRNGWIYLFNEEPADALLLNQALVKVSDLIETMQMRK